MVLLLIPDQVREEPKVYSATSSQHVAQQAPESLWSRSDWIRVFRPAVQSWGREQCALVVLFSQGLVMGLPLTVVGAGLGHSHLSVQASPRRIWMIRTRMICVLG